MANVIVRRISLAAGVCAAALLAAAAFSNIGSAQEGQTTYKIGVVDMKRCLAEYNKRETMYRELQRQVDERQKRIDQLSQEVERLQQRYSETRDPAERQRIENEYNDKAVEYRAELERNQRQIDAEETRVLQELITDVRNTIEQIGQEQHFHIILDARNPAGGGVLFHAPTVEITSQVLQRLNAR